MDPVVHFEMPAEDKQRMAKFYTDVFDWKTRILGPEMGDYVLAQTAETDENRMLKEPGRINGGFFPKRADSPMQHPSVSIAVKDIKASAQKVKDGGGTVHGEPVMIPGIGWYVAFTDTEGNVNSMLQPTDM
ncbi:MAG TPA: VOC family protein [Candidatus Binatia bacterium]|nr:VOC family protein [Candidatus Binatia bacterium]